MSLKMRVKNSESIIEPLSMSIEEKRKLYNSKVILICTCRRDTELKYAFRKNTFALYPLHNRYMHMHAPFCELNEQYHETDYANFVDISEDGTIYAHAAADIRKRPTGYTTDDIRDYTIKECPLREEAKRQADFSQLVVSINLETWSRLLERIKNGKAKTKKATDFSREVYKMAENTMLKNIGVNMAGKSLLSYGTRFYYARIRGLYVYEYAKGKREEKLKTYVNRDYLDFLKKRIDEKKKTIVKICYEAAGGNEEAKTISDKTLYQSFMQFLNTYNKAAVSFDRCIVMGAFYTYEDEYRDAQGERRHSGIIDRMVFVLTNNYGIISESPSHALAYDMIMEYCSANKGLYFHKPYRFSNNAYGGKYLEDALIEVENGRRIVLEVHGFRWDDDRKKIRDIHTAQNKDVYVFLEWERDEGKDILLAKLRDCIEISKIIMRGQTNGTENDNIRRKGGKIQRHVQQGLHG